MPNYNTPEIQPVLEAVQQEIDEMLPESVKAMYGTADDCIKRIHSEMTQEDWTKWGKRDGESDLEHYRRCSSQLWEGEDRVAVGEALDPRGTPWQGEDFTEEELQQYSECEEDGVL